jgi:ribosomal protein S1
VEEVVNQGADGFIHQITEHREVRKEKKYSEPEPACLEVVIIQADDEQYRARLSVKQPSGFQVQHTAESVAWPIKLSS